jgi:hypothetical protein
MLAHYYAATFGVMQGSTSQAASASPSSRTSAARMALPREKRRVLEPLRVARLDRRLLQDLLIRI